MQGNNKVHDSVKFKFQRGRKNNLSHPSLKAQPNPRRRSAHLERIDAIHGEVECIPSMPVPQRMLLACQRPISLWRKPESVKTSLRG